MVAVVAAMWILLIFVILLVFVFVQILALKMGLTQQNKEVVIDDTTESEQNIR